MNHPLEVSPAHVMADTQPHIIIDVREDWERALSCLPHALSYPMNRLIDQQENLRADAAGCATVYVLCHHGLRSLQSAQVLRALGFHNAVSIRGGIHGWSEVDPSIPRY